MDTTRRPLQAGSALARALLAWWVVGSLFATAGAATTSLDGVRELASQGRGDEALRDLDQILVDRPDDRDGLFLKGVLLVEMRRTAEAEAVFAELISRHPQLPEPYNNLAVLQAAGGRYDAAVDTLQRALETHTSYETAYSNLTKIYGQLASEAYDRALIGDSTPPAEVVELVLLGNIGVPMGQGEPRSGVAPIARVEEPLAPAPMAQSDEAVTVALAEPLPIEAPAEPPQPPVVVDQEADEEDLWATVDAWAAAWAGQRVDDFLSFYSSRFQPRGMSRGAWERQRRDRLTAPEYIKVRIAVREAELRSPTTSSVTFIQQYESNTFADTVTKTLELVLEDGTWKILSETLGE